jgi:hypothetical protein
VAPVAGRAIDPGISSFVGDQEEEMRAGEIGAVRKR